MVVDESLTGGYAPSCASEGERPPGTHHPNLIALVVVHRIVYAGGVDVVRDDAAVGVAVVTRAGGVEAVTVVELDGELVEVDTGDVVELVDVVVVVGLPELDAVS